MKKVLGGELAPLSVDTVYCNDGTTTTPPEGDCSVGLCDGHNGVKNCIAGKMGRPSLFIFNVFLFHF